MNATLAASVAAAAVLVALLRALKRPWPFVVLAAAVLVVVSADREDTSKLPC